MKTMVLDVIECGGASGSNKMLVASVVAINQMHSAMKCMEIFQHKRRDQVTAVNKQFCAFPVGKTDGPLQVGDMVVAVRYNGDKHGSQCAWTARVGRRRGSSTTGACFLD